MAFDTSAKSASVAVCSEDAILCEFNLNTRLTHSQTILPMAQSALSCAKLTLSDMDAFAVAAGPGSFTGLRIGIAAVKGMAQATGKPCIAVSTLDALAHNLQGFEGILCPVMDARCNQVYNTLLEADGTGMHKLCADRAITLDELSADLKKYENKIILVGDGAVLCYNNCDKMLQQLVLAPLSLRLQHASSVAAVAFEQFLRGDTVSAFDLMPSYLRLSQAERQLNAKQEIKK